MATNAQSPEFRAYWVEAFNDGLKSAAQIDELLSVVRASNMNAVIVQMRKRGNTYYPSSIDPWAPDADQTFDALDYLLRQAHDVSPRIDVHCWFCTLPVWKDKDEMPADPNHIIHRHPEWLTQNADGEKWDESNYCLDPGVPEAVQYTCDVVMDVVKRYDVDGIHYDYIRYCDRNWGYNPVAVQRFNALYGRSGVPSVTDPEWSQFRRDQVSAIPRRIYAEAVAIKPKLQMSASTIAWGDGPATDDDWLQSSAYADTLQDWRGWMEEGIIDISVPMTYFREAEHASYYDNWIAFEKTHKYGRHLVIGQGAYLNSPGSVLTQLKETRTSQEGCTADGQCMYVYQVPCLDGRGEAASFAGKLVSELYPSPVPVPDMPWKSASTLGHIKGTVTGRDGKPADGATVAISGPESRTIRTDGAGFYAFIDLKPGTYTVSLPDEAAQVVVEIEVERVADVDIRLG